MDDPGLNARQRKHVAALRDILRFLKRARDIGRAVREHGRPPAEVVAEPRARPPSMGGIGSDAHSPADASEPAPGP